MARVYDAATGGESEGNGEGKAEALDVLPAFSSQNCVDIVNGHFELLS